MNKNEHSIPKIIHYCWFGGKDKPDIVKKCINSWRSILVDYEIIEWNEDNFDININKFARQAYDAGKFAFVSDYVRVFALYNHGGIYLDTDVEVLKPLDRFLKHESFWGFEEKNYIATSTIGARKGNSLIRRFMDTYNNRSFILENGEQDTLTNVAVVTEILKEIGVKMDGMYQELKGVGTFYPQSYFSPFDYINCIYRLTENSFTVHHFYKSWLPVSARIKSSIKMILAKIIGGERIAKLRQLKKSF
jgi:hypothetical protein